MNKIQNYILNHDICVIACIESIQNKKGEQYLDVWLMMEKYFSLAQVPVLLLSRDDYKTCFQIKKIYATKYLFFHDKEDQFFQQYHVIKNKLIFGKEKNVVYPYSFIFVDGVLVKTVKRMNEKSVGDIFLYVLEMRYKKFLKNFKKMFDIGS